MGDHSSRYPSNDKTSELVPAVSAAVFNQVGEGFFSHGMPVLLTRKTLLPAAHAPSNAAASSNSSRTFLMSVWAAASGMQARSKAMTVCLATRNLRAKARPFPATAPVTMAAGISL